MLASYRFNPRCAIVGKDSILVTSRAFTFMGTRKGSQFYDITSYGLLMRWVVRFPYEPVTIP